MGMFERLPCGSWMQRIQHVSGNQETLVGRKEEDLDRPLFLEVQGTGTCARYRKVGVLLGRTLGSSSQSKNSGNQTHENIVGVLVLR